MQRGLFDDQSSMTLTAYIVKNEGCEREGIVCMVDGCCPEKIIDDDREDFLRRLAGDAEHQLHCRRQHFLKKGNWDASASPFETLQNRRGYRHDIVLPAHGPIQAVLKSHITQRLQTQAPFQFDHNSSGYNKLPVFQNMSTEAERMHLPLDFYDSVDQIPGPRPPISKNDMEYSAVVESLALTEINPEDAIAIHLKQMVKMATQVFAFPNCEITFMNHNTIFCLAGHAESERKSDSITTMKRNKDGSRFLWTMPRAQAICNYVIAAGGSFVVQDLATDESFQWLAPTVPFQCYAGTAIKDSCGRVIAVLCLFDSKPRPDFETAHEMQLEQMACLISQSIENWALKRSLNLLENERKIIRNGRDKHEPPRARVVLVLSDVEGYIDMETANHFATHAGRCLYDGIIKKLRAKHFGYDAGVDDESAGICVFHDPVDAFGFALQAQMALYEANWSEELLQMSLAKEERGAYRGFRVKMAVHLGDVDPSQDDYRGEVMNVAKHLLEIAHGGQILATSETWEVASYCIASASSFPQVLDHGSHILRKGKTTRDGVITKRVVQLVPVKLAYDYFAARKLTFAQSEKQKLVEDRPGRQFPPLSSFKKVGLSFHDAPFAYNMVTTAFVNLSAISDPEASLVVNLIGILLDGLPEFGGYQCQSEMLAFHRPADAILFGLYLQKELATRKSQGDRLDGSQVAKLITYACLHEPFLTMGPHRTTGRADYFGKIVNRAARLSRVVTSGTVCFGIVRGSSSDDGSSLKQAVAVLADPSVKCRFSGKKKLKGVSEEVSVYEYSCVALEK